MYSAFETTAISKNYTMEDNEESENLLYESKMLYEKDSFEYKFVQKGKYVLKVMNIPNVSLNVIVKESFENLSQCNSFSQSNKSFISSKSLSQWMENSAIFKSVDHKMNKDINIQYFNILDRDINPETKFCDYFGEKISLIEKYQILDKIMNFKETNYIHNNSIVLNPFEGFSKIKTEVNNENFEKVVESKEEKLSKGFNTIELL